jgi:RNA polymerase sigma-70 factor (ECF subfamily)
MAEAPATFTTQNDAHRPWAAFLDEIAPLRPDLFRYCCGLTGNVWDGEDLVQDVLARVFSFLGKNYQPIEHPRAYLIRAATHLWTDRVRRANLERAHAQGAVVDETADDDPEQGLAVREAANRLFLHLAPQERAAVLLKDVLDFSLQEIAAMLKTSAGAVKSALHRGRSRLRESQAQPAEKHTVPREIVDRFVAALSAKEFDAIRALCLEDVTVDMVGGARFETWEQGKATVEHAHMVMPSLGFGEDPKWRTVLYEGEPMAIGLRTLDGVEGLNEIWRFEFAEDGRVGRVRLYCFNPDILAAVGSEIGVPALRRPYRFPA